MKLAKEACMKRIQRCGVVPVATIDEAEKAAPLAEAMLAGGIDVIEVTFRTDAAPDAIRLISRDCPDMLIGAGTVTSVEQCVQAVERGANFIVCPGFDEVVVSWCAEREIPVLPGCVTPSEILAAQRLGVEVLKFFPADICGGAAAMKALSGPFPHVRFIPTSGVNINNAADYIRCPFIYAVGGSWVCPRDAIRNGDFERITALCAETRKRILGFDIGHIGINCGGPEESEDICSFFLEAFDFEYKPGSGSSDFSSDRIEIKKAGGKGTHGHLAISTNRIECAIGEMERRGIALTDERVYKNGRLIAVWLRDEVGGFAIHLLEK